MKRKKYSTGTSVKNYMTNPSTELNKNDINIAKAQSESENNPITNIMSAMGNMAMQYGMSQEGFTEGMGGEGNANLAKAFGPMLANMKFGGTASNVPVEIEGEEAVKVPGGKAVKAKGPSHENGGIKLDLPEGTDIFSKRIMVEGKTMAERELARSKQVEDYEILLEKNDGDSVLMNSLKKTLSNNKLEEGRDKKLQEIITGMQELNKFTKRSETQKAKGGTGNRGLQANGARALGSSNISEEEGENGFQLTPGDALGLAGTLYSAFAPMNNTRKARAEDTPNINAFENYGEDALARLEESKTFVDDQQDKALQDLALTENTAIKRGRNSARGVNTSRALDVAAVSNTNKAQGDIYDNFSKQMMGLLSKQAGFENMQDDKVMQGEATRDDNDRRDKDNYFSQLAKDIATKGQGIQQVGKMSNEIKKNNVSENLLDDSSKGYKVDSKGNVTLKDGTKELSYAEIAALAKAKNMTVDEWITSINK